MNLKNILIALITIVALGLNAKAQSSEVSFKVDKKGNGKKNIIFIPGFASSGDVWLDTRDAIGKDYTSYILTMPGFAGAPTQTDPTFKGWKEMIIKYIKENKIEKPILVGHSMGGVLAMDIAATDPELLSKIIIVDAVPCLVALSNPNFKSNPNLDCSPMVQQFSLISNEQFDSMQKQTMTTLVTDTVKQKILVDWSIRSDRSTFAKMFCDFSNVDLRNDIEHIKCPTLVLLNSQFNQIKPTIEKQYEKLNGANLKYAENSLHFIMYDARDWYIDQVQKFLN